MTNEMNIGQINDFIGGLLSEGHSYDDIANAMCDGLLLCELGLSQSDAEAIYSIAKSRGEKEDSK